ncbi:MAG: tRNA (guanosine(37)-N1)-methyltransferase TrmD [Candidatus Magasanikbacteria bacterium CG_4_10_14_0_8_um_filter_32_14]|uniref:tRNA (guanine-N(1)-)-methyltransferase n=2 Tax=Candidatus Magasanikiibacteriota TaxID=1752731 RepID=A0A2M7RA71_9BACT|nr:MAG: tRNA (guanosine(37)-N1)-methyltransferase TrmD [Candidatus Magasanikbacteria bacterium CG1_02_32_51]PIY93679.1 MAG: tRNA (guanosine(37)-N1)-methyltransferase TrmD [Candidatus Magasanikbacteria bacterium CG_4_10_14_0_8_um_filter_32_14]
MQFNVITIFPDIITSYSNESILGRGQKAGAIKIKAINLRDFTLDKHNKVDDTPYGGGPGMILGAEPIYRALKSIDAIPFAKVDGLTKIKKVFNGSLKNKKRTILLSPRGTQFDQKIAEKFSKLDEITFICGRYEGIDQRVTDHMIDEEISIGPYVLAGGELGALTIIEAVARLIPGVLGNIDSTKDETFSSSQGEYPQYTKPADYKGWKVPDVLLSGDHKKIEEWRKKNSK